MLASRWILLVSAFCLLAVVLAVVPRTDGNPTAMAPQRQALSRPIRNLPPQPPNSQPPKRTMNQQKIPPQPRVQMRRGQVNVNDFNGPMPSSNMPAGEPTGVETEVTIKMKRVPARRTADIQMPNGAMRKLAPPTPPKRVPSITTPAETSRHADNEESFATCDPVTGICKLNEQRKVRGVKRELLQRDISEMEPLHEDDDESLFEEEQIEEDYYLEVFYEAYDQFPEEIMKTDWVYLIVFALIFTISFMTLMGILCHRKKLKHRRTINKYRYNNSELCC